METEVWVVRVHHLFPIWLCFEIFHGIWVSYQWKQCSKSFVDAHRAGLTAHHFQCLDLHVRGLRAREIQWLLLDQTASWNDFRTEQGPSSGLLPLLWPSISVRVESGPGKYSGHGATVTSKHVNKVLLGPISSTMLTSPCLILESYRKKFPGT